MKHKVIITHSKPENWKFHLNREYYDVTPRGSIPFGIALNKLEPGGETTRHKHVENELFIIQSGNVEAHIADKKYSLKIGSTCFVPSYLEHNLKNSSNNSVVEFICIWWET